jgi:hypothetical protein
VLYSIRRRVGSRPRTRCPQRIKRNKVPGTSVEAGGREADERTGQVVARLSATRDRTVRRGRNRIRLSRQVARLRPGTYQLIVRATDGAANRSPDQIVKFWILRPRSDA